MTFLTFCLGIRQFLWFFLSSSRCIVLQLLCMCFCRPCCNTSFFFLFFLCSMEIPIWNDNVILIYFYFNQYRWWFVLTCVGFWGHLFLLYQTKKNKKMLRKIHKTSFCRYYATSYRYSWCHPIHYRWQTTNIFVVDLIRPLQWIENNFIPCRCISAVLVNFVDVCS